MNISGISREGIFQLEFAILILYGIRMIVKKVEIKKWLISISFGLYVAIIIAICFFPINLDDSATMLTNNFIPFKSTIESISELLNNNSKAAFLSVFGNFALLMPLSIFLHYYEKDLKRHFLNVFLFSVSIETIQYIIGLLIGCNYRSIDIDDVILNTIGGIIGILVFRIFKKLYYRTIKN